jgi:hypothetical protein
MVKRVDGGDVGLCRTNEKKKESMDSGVRY